MIIKDYFEINVELYMCLILENLVYENINF